MPAPLLDQDPWLLLTSARRYASLGRWEAALDTWRRAEVGFGVSPAAETCRRERQALASWLEAEGAGQVTEWTGALRSAVRRDPRRAASSLETGTTMARFVAGIGALVAGHVGEADIALSAVEDADDASEVIAVAAAIAGAVARSLCGQPSAVDLDQHSERADAAGMPWLASLARSALALEIGAGVAPELVERERSGKSDGWANGFADVFLGLGQLRAGMRVIDLDDALAWFEQVDAPVLQVWTLAVAALSQARTGGSAAGSMARSARALARSVGAPGPLAIASAALALVEPEQATDHEAAALAAAS